MPPRFYLLHGPDEFASAEYLAALKTKLGDPAMGDLNTAAFDGRSATLPEVRAIADTLPFLTARRLVVVEGWLTRLVGRDQPAGDEPAEEPASEDARRGSSSREQMAALAEYLPNLPDSTA